MDAPCFSLTFDIGIKFHLSLMCMKQEGAEFPDVCNSALGSKT